MILGSVVDSDINEKRIAISLDTVKKYISNGFSVQLEKDFGKNSNINDSELQKLGAKISTKDEIYKTSDIIIKINCPSDSEISLIKDGSVLIGSFFPHLNKDKINKLLKKNIKIFSLELLPRITRAQSMDILSSQANLAGYKAVIDSVYEFNKAVPMMMTAAGTITPAKFFVIGAGVAGLQAIATAKRLGGVVSATDVRSASKEQVESLEVDSLCACSTTCIALGVVVRFVAVRRISNHRIHLAKRWQDVHAVAKVKGGVPNLDHAHALTTTLSMRCTSGFAGSPDTSSLSPYFFGASLERSHLRVSTWSLCFCTAAQSFLPSTATPTS